MNTVENVYLDLSVPFFKKKLSLLCHVPRGTQIFILPISSNTKYTNLHTLYEICHRIHKFATEVSSELDWVSERAAAARSSALPADLHAAQAAQKRHAKLRAELCGRAEHVARVLERGRHVQAGHPQAQRVSVARGGYTMLLFVFLVSRLTG